MSAMKPRRLIAFLMTSTPRKRRQSCVRWPATMSTTKSCERSIVQSVKRKDRRIMSYSTALLILFDKVRQWFLSWNLPSTASVSFSQMRSNTTSCMHLGPFSPPYLSAHRKMICATWLRMPSELYRRNMKMHWAIHGTSLGLLASLREV